jgi:hypothetical protein
LPSVEWRTGQSSAPSDSHCRQSGADLLPFLVQTTVVALGQLTHWTVRCPLPTIGVGHASPADCATDHCTGDRWFTGQSGAPPDSPMNYSRTLLNFSRERPFHRSPAWRTGHCPVHHRTLSGAPPGSPVCQTELSFGCTQPVFCNPFLFFFSLFLTLR